MKVENELLLRISDIMLFTSVSIVQRLRPSNYVCYNPLTITTDTFKNVVFTYLIDSLLFEDVLVSTVLVLNLSKLKK